MLALRRARFIACDDGERACPAELCVDLESDLSAAARALPPHLRGFVAFFELCGARASHAVAPPAARVRAACPHATLAGRIARQLNDPALADVEIALAGDDGGGEVVLYAHKLVLALASPVFAAMFASALAEGVQASGARGRARIAVGADVSARAFSAALQYLYRGELPAALAPHAPPSDDGLALACELLQLADLYELEHLKQTLEAEVTRWDVVDVHNACALATHAHACNAAQLLAACVFFLREMHAVVSVTPQWAELPRAVVEAVVDPFRRRGALAPAPASAAAAGGAAAARAGPVRVTVGAQGALEVEGAGDAGSSAQG